MGLFSGLSEQLNRIFSKLSNRGRLSESDIKAAMREVRIALLEADVNILVAKDFINRVSEKALNQEILNSLTPTQQVIKIVNDELKDLMGSENQKLLVSPTKPTIIMMCGLQGAGKTTMCGKLAHYLKKQGKKTMLVACDIYRPAAIEQLRVVSNKAEVDFYEMGQKDVVDIAKNGIKQASRFDIDYVIIDTAGRLQIDEQLMDELVRLKKAINPTEILLTVDAMTGQEAANVAKEFNDKLDITGVVLTKLDGDTRGGAALSIKSIANKPIKFSGTGEKIGDIEPFYPDRMAQRILGMGDVLTLIEKAEEVYSEEDAKRFGNKLKNQTFTLDDFLEQMEAISKMGNLQDIAGMLPGLGNVQVKDVDEKRLVSIKAIIQSMTKKERKNPEIIKASRRQRIAKGSGTTIQEVNRTLNQFEQLKEMMRKMSSGKGRFNNFKLF